MSEQPEQSSVPSAKAQFENLLDRFIHEDPFLEVSPLLGFGIFICPIIFVWWLLESGRSLRARVFGFGWLLITACVAAFSGS